MYEQGFCRFEHVEFKTFWDHVELKLGWKRKEKCSPRITFKNNKLFTSTFVAKTFSTSVQNPKHLRFQRRSWAEDGVGEDFKVLTSPLAKQKVCCDVCGAFSYQMLHNAENKVVFVLLMSEGEHAAVTEVQDLIITQFWVTVPDFWPLERAAKFSLICWRWRATEL